MPGILERGYEAMSMTRKEAADIIENKIQIDVRLCTDKEVDRYQEALYMALSAIRTPTREMVEKVWRGECDCSNPKACCTCCSMRCQYCIGQSEYKQATFCMKCGRPLTEEAVEMVMERLEALKDE